MSSERKKLQKIFDSLPMADQHALLQFAEFLATQNSQLAVQDIPAEPFPEPVIVDAQENESVVGAIKRLSLSYPMLNKTRMLDKTSSLMSEHIVQGRNKQDVIADLEALFEEQYKNLVGRKEK